MKNKKVIMILAVMTVVLICCKTNKSVSSANISSKAKPTLVPDSTDVAIAHAHWSATTFLALNQGYTLFNDKCTECHGIKKPQDFTIDEWNNILPGMGQRAHLDSTQYTLVYHYILTKREAMLSQKN